MTMRDAAIVPKVYMRTSGRRCWADGRGVRCRLLGANAMVHTDVAAYTPKTSIRQAAENKAPSAMLNGTSSGKPARQVGRSASECTSYQSCTYHLRDYTRYYGTRRPSESVDVKKGIGKSE